MVREVEAAINPDTVLCQGNILLRVDRPLTGLGNQVAQFVLQETFSCAPKA